MTPARGHPVPRARAAAPTSSSSVYLTPILPHPLSRKSPPRERRPGAHPEGAHQANDADGELGLEEGEEGHAHDNEVEDAPAVAYEAPEPVGVGVDCKLDGEGSGEEDAEAAQGAGDDGIVPVVGLELLGP